MQQAIEAGRITATKNAAGRWVIDPARADAEWSASTYADRVPLTGPTAPRNRAAPGAEPEEVPNLAEARARLDAARAELAEMDLAERRGELVPAHEVEARMVAVFSSCKTKLLGVPSRVRQQDPALTREQLALLDAAIREALEGLAGPPAERGNSAA